MLVLATTFQFCCMKCKNVSCQSNVSKCNEHTDTFVIMKGNLDWFELTMISEYTVCIIVA